VKCELWSINQNLATGPQLISLSFIIFSCDEQLYKRHVVSVRLSVRHISHAYNFASIHPIFLKLTWNIPPTRPFLTFSFEVVGSKVTSVGGHFVFWAKKKFVSRRYIVFNSTDWDEIHREHATWAEEDTCRFRRSNVKWRPRGGHICYTLSIFVGHRSPEVLHTSGCCYSDITFIYLVYSFWLIWDIEQSVRNIL